MNILRALKNVQFSSSARKAGFFAAGILVAFRGVEVAPDPSAVTSQAGASIGQRGAFFKCLVLKLAFACCLILFAPAGGFAEDLVRIPCEVLEVSPEPDTDAARLSGCRFMLIHHANAADRPLLSRWLKENSGKEVTFVVDRETGRGVLYRLAHCFGRGLLIHGESLKVEARDIIEVFLTPAQRKKQDKEVRK